MKELIIKEASELNDASKQILETIANRKVVTLNEEKLRKEREEAESDSEQKDPEEAVVEALDDKKDEDVFPEGAYNDEVLNITLDYLNILTGRKTVKR